MSGFLTIAARCAIIGGVLRIVASFIPYIPESPWPETPWLEGYYAVIDICLMFGLIGIFAQTVDIISVWGKFGWTIAMIGQASIIGPDARMFGIDFYMAGSVTLLTGLAIWSLAMLRGGVMRAAAGWWLTGGGLAVATILSGIAGLVPAAGVALGFGFVHAGRACLAPPQPTARPAIQPA